MLIADGFYHGIMRVHAAAEQHWLVCSAAGNTRSDAWHKAHFLSCSRA